MSAPILKFFAYEHLPPALQEVSRPIGDLARSMDATLPDGAEKSTGLRKLLEAKDAFVRAALPVLLLVAAMLGLAACQSAPLEAPQSARQDSGSPLTSPVDQARAFVYAPTYIVGSGSGISGESKGLDGSGDLRSAESLRSALTGAPQSSSPSNTVAVDPAAVAKAATDLLATVAPGGPAATLLMSAVNEAKAGSPTKAAELLRQGQDAAKAEAAAKAALDVPPVVKTTGN